MMPSVPAVDKKTDEDYECKSEEGADNYKYFGDERIGCEAWRRGKAVLGGLGLGCGLGGREVWWRERGGCVFGVQGKHHGRRRSVE